MKSFVKFFTYAFVFLIAILIIGLVVVLNPIFQTKVVLSAMDGVFQEVHLNRIKIGLGGLELNEFAFKDNQIEVSLESVDLRWSLLPALLKREVRLSKLEVKNILVDLSQQGVERGLEVSLKEGDLHDVLRNADESNVSDLDQTGNKAANKDKVKSEKKPLFRGLFVEELVGLKVYLDGVLITGKVILEDDQVGNFKISGGGLKPESTGELELYADFSDGAEGAQIQQVLVKGTIGIQQKKDSGIDGIYLSLNGEAKGEALAQTAKLKVSAQAEKQESAEKYSLFIAERTEETCLTDLLKLNANLDKKTGLFEGEFELLANRSQIDPFLLGFDLPEFNVTSRGSYRFSTQDEKGEVEFNLNLEASELQRLQPELSEIGAFYLSSNLSAEIEAKDILLKKLNSALLGKNKNKLLNLNLLQAVQISFKDGRSLFTADKGDILKIELVELPVAYLDPFLKDIDLKSGALSAEFMVQSNPDLSLNLNASKPITLNKLTVTQKEAVLLDTINLQFQPKLTYNGEYIHLQYDILNINSQDRDLLNAQGECYVYLLNGLRLKANGSLKMHVQNIIQQPVLLKNLNDFPNVGLLAGMDYQVECEDSSILLNLLNLQVSTRDVANMIDLKLMHPLALTLPEGEKPIDWNMPHEAWMALKINQFPIALINGFVRDYNITGKDISGSFVVSGQNQKGILMSAKEPVVLRELSVESKNEKLLNTVTLSVVPSMRYEVNAVELTWIDLKGFDSQSTFLTGSTYILADLNQKEPLKILKRADLDMNIDLAALMKQPVFATLQNLRAGNMKIQGSIDLEKTGTMHLSTKMENMQLIQPSEAIAAASVIVEGKYDEKNRKITGNKKVHVRGPRGESDLMVQGFYIIRDLKAEDVNRFDAKIIGENLILDDIILLGDAFNSPEYKKLKQSGQKNMPQKINLDRDEEAFWGNQTGQGILSIKRLSYDKYIVNDVAAKMTMNPNRLELSSAQAILAGSPFKFDAGVDFNASNENPYNLLSQFNLTDFDVGTFLAAGKDKPMEGRVTMVGKATGIGINLDQVLERLQGDFRLTSSGGLFRIMSSFDPKLQVGASILGVAGGLLGGKVTGMDTFAQLINFLKEVKYDYLSAKTHRGSDLDIQLQELIVKNPDILLTGSGLLQHQDDVPIVKQPMKMNVRLDVKNEAEKLLGSLGLLKGGQSEDYAIGPSFSVGGTLENPDYSNLYRIIREAALNVVMNNVQGSSSNQTQSSSQGQEQQQSPAGSNPIDQGLNKVDKLFKKIF